MKFSICLPFPSDDPSAEEVDGLLELALAVEGAGLDACAAADHPFPAFEPGRAGHQALDPFVVLSQLAAVTQRLLLHFNVIVLPYRNPFLAARMIATLDLLSRGRVIVGIGAGYMRKEFDALGAGFAGRGTHLEEDVAAMKAAWSGEPVTLQTDRYRATGNVMSPRPATRPSPILWRGGNGRLAIESAVRAFDGWTPFEVTEEWARDTTTTAMSIETLPVRMAALRAEEERAGRTCPVEVCYVRSTTGWLRNPLTAIAELQALDRLGIGWVSTHIYGTTTPEKLEGVRALAELATTAGVR